MYQSKISSTIVIDKEKGSVKLNQFDVKIDGYKNRGKLRKARDAYNSDKNLEKEYKNNDWPAGIWNYLFEDYFKILEKWKKRINKKK
ncbi:MAG: hypothetical protein GTN36_03985 [Candidatus Aenigmarchaeota archaeon]|nr:hypothetical protein [Candidatus Aenigmarchaeota archaeon]